MKRLRSTILTAAICLALGAAASYAVAWGIAWRAKPGLAIAAPFSPAGSIARNTLPFEPTNFNGALFFAPTIEQVEVEGAEVGWGRSARRITFGSLAPVVSEATVGIDPELEFVDVYEEQFGFPKRTAARWSLWGVWPSTWSSGPHPAPRTFDGGWWAYSRSSGTEEVRFPLRPIWPGLIINSIVYGIVAWALWRGVIAVRARWRRTLGDVCLKCRYPRGTSPVCTECGEAFGIGMASNAKAGG